MRTLIVPCAVQKKYAGTPFFLHRHPEDGVILACKAISGIFPKSYDRIVFTILREIDEECGASDIIKEEMSKQGMSADVVILESETAGPAETVCETIYRAKVSDSIAVKDSHSYIQIQQPIVGNGVAGLDLTEYDEPLENLRSKSFVVINEQRQILDIVEKRFRSDVISAGLYSFKNANDYLAAYNRLSDPNYHIEKMYLSHVISYLIGYENRVFRCENVTVFEDWGSASALMKAHRDHATYFLDMDSLFGTDDDVMIAEKIGHSSKLKKYSKKGAKYVACFHSLEIDGEAIGRALQESGVNCIQVVKGCSSSSVKTVISSWELFENALQ